MVPSSPTLPFVERIESAAPPPIKHEFFNKIGGKPSFAALNINDCDADYAAVPQGPLLAHEGVRIDQLTFHPLETLEVQKKTDLLMRAVQIICVLLVMSGLAYWFMFGADSNVTNAAEEPASAIVEINVPETLSANAKVGKVAFQAKCSVCHGANAVGQADIAPPLIHKIYEPSHHADEAFQRAVSVGVRQHHWPFGNMPAVEGLTRGDVTMIIAYIRELQRANGIK